MAVFRCLALSVVRCFGSKRENKQKTSLMGERAFSDDDQAKPQVLFFEKKRSAAEKKNERRFCRPLRLYESKKQDDDLADLF